MAVEKRKEQALLPIVQNWIAGSAGATEVAERVAVPDKAAVLDKVAVLDEVAWGKGGLTGVPVATFLTFSVTILRSRVLAAFPDTPW